MRVLFCTVNNEVVAAEVDEVVAKYYQGDTCFTFEYKGTTYTAIALTPIDAVSFLKSDVLDFTRSFKMTVMEVNPVDLHRDCTEKDTIAGIDNTRHKVVVLDPGTGRVQLIARPISIGFPF